MRELTHQEVISATVQFPKSYIAPAFLAAPVTTTIGLEKLVSKMLDFVLEGYRTQFPNLFPEGRNFYYEDSDLSDFCSGLIEHFVHIVFKPEGLPPGFYHHGGCFPEYSGAQGLLVLRSILGVSTTDTSQLANLYHQLSWEELVEALNNYLIQHGWNPNEFDYEGAVLEIIENGADNAQL